MSLSLVPESAPFSQEQRAWLNGFLAGMLCLENAPADAQEMSGTGVAQSLMETQAVEESGEDFPWHDAGLDLSERMELAKGKPVALQMMAAMAQLDCGACGYLCQSYSAAIASGEEKSLSKCVPGGKPTSKMLKNILEECGAGESQASSHGKTDIGGHVAMGYSREKPVSAKLVSSERLNGQGSEKDTRHVVIDLTQTQLHYEVGDALGVYPTNCEELVSAIANEFDVAVDQEVAISGIGPRTVGDYLKHESCLKDLNDEIVDVLVSACESPEEQEALRQLVDNDDLGELDLLDVLRTFPNVRPPIGEFLSRLSPLSPRLYSIASSQKRTPSQVHLTVGRQVRDVRGRMRKGVASTMFSDRIEPEESIRVFVHRSPGFCVPSDDQVPLIMVGPGTGIAPFRAFLEERAARGARGKNWLFFGDQKSSCDFLYREELQRYLDSGVLTRLDTAFSRDQAEKIYVQNRMLDAGEEIFAWLEEGGSFCVCGDAKRMARDVDQALHAIVEHHGTMTAAQAKAYISKLTREKRYLRDVY